MSIFGTIMSKVFGTHTAAAAPAPAGGASATPASTANASSADTSASASGTGPSRGDETPAPPASTAPTSSAPTSSSGSASTEASTAPSTAPSSVDITAVLDGMEGQAGQKLDWRHSIVDLMKLLDMDSSLSARKELAHELHYTGDTNDSASMNMWLHKEVMKKFAENGGKLPADLH